MNGFLNNVKMRFFFGLVATWITFAVLFTAMGSGVFFSKLSNGIAIYNTISEKELKKDLPMAGTLYGVYDMVASYETETTNKFGRKSTTTDFYYYAIPFEDNVVMILKTKADSSLDKQVYALLEACYEEGDTSILESGVNIEGVLKPTDSEVVSFTKSTFAESEIHDIKVLPYTFDCSFPINHYITYFRIGIACSVSFAAALIIFIYKMLSNKKNAIIQGQAQYSNFVNNSYANSIPEYRSENNYTTQSQSRNYDTTYNSYDNSASRQQNFIPQSQSRNYDTTYNSYDNSASRQQNFIPQSQSRNYDSTYNSYDNSASRQQNFIPQSQDYGFSNDPDFNNDNYN